MRLLHHLEARHPPARQVEAGAQPGLHGVGLVAEQAAVEDGILDRDVEPVAVERKGHDVPVMPEAAGDALVGVDPIPLLLGTDLPSCHVHAVGQVRGRERPEIACRGRAQAPQPQIGAEAAGLQVEVAERGHVEPEPARTRRPIASSPGLGHAQHQERHRHQHAGRDTPHHVTSQLAFAFIARSQGLSQPKRVLPH